MKKVMLVGLMLGIHAVASAQQKVKDGSVVGSNLPNKDAILELESSNKGLLHVKVGLTRTTDSAPLTAHVAGMMVYNTATVNDVLPGIYYNDGTKWVFVRSSNSIIVENQLGKAGSPGIPGTAGGPGAGVTIVNNDSGTWVFNPATNSWTNIKGAAGTNGTNGTSVKSGTTAPTGTGATGDTYINTTTGDTYVYNGTSWVSNGNIKGPTGPAGTNGINGTSVTSGATAPTGTGATGDTYINTTTGDTYVYNGTSWVSNGNIKGPKGDTGAPGAAGTNGINGISVTSGATAPTGTGATGDTYINTTTGDTYVYNGTSWVSNGNIKGPKGDTGAAGTTATVTADNGLTKTAGNIQLGGALITPTTITTDLTNTLAIAGLQSGFSTDNIIVANPLTGLLRSVSPSVFTADLRVVGTNNHVTQDAGAGGNGTSLGSGSTNIAIGNTIMGSILAGSGNIGIGSGSFNSLQNGDENIVLGRGSLGDLQTGKQNIVIGNNSGGYLDDVNNNIIIGNSIAGKSANGQYLSDLVNINNSIYATNRIGNSNGRTALGAFFYNSNTDNVFKETLNIGSGSIWIKDINSATYSGNTATDKIVVANPDGVLKTVNASALAANNIYNANGSLTANRTVNLNGKSLTFQGSEGNLNIEYGGSYVNIHGSNPDRARFSLSTDDINGNGTASAFNMSLFSDNYLQMYALGDMNGISFGTHATLNPSPIEFVTSPGANALGETRMTITGTGEVAIGAASAPSFVVGATTIQPLLHVAGDISTTGKIYTTNSVYADYVFEDYFNGFSKIYKDYKFKSLKEVAEYIKENKHLPGVTPIDDLAKSKSGYTIDLTQLSVQQLEKLEELYLHVIEMNDALSQKDKEIKALQNKTTDLEERLKKLEYLLIKK